jgi:thymidylate synthase (FAD)
MLLEPIRDIHSAQLVHITPEAEKIIAYCARVSSPNQDNPSVENLLEYCFKKGHWSIFEMANMCVEIVTTRRISPQILRHRSFSFQQFSERYSSPNTHPNLPNLVESSSQIDFRMQDYKNRQNSLPCTLSESQQALLYSRLADLAKHSEALYDDLISAGIAKEVAASVLPEFQPTRLYMNGNIRSFIHYVQVRTKDDTQLEHRLIAQSVKNILLENVPSLTSLL